ncbi:MAG: hypothetical protein DRP47_12860 [Candidatus Zixiibacteriota bacterium]|nr:MAG: hypothetical protein DRP47_12860 [candidate division Zixibacteria bacterium]
MFKNVSEKASKWFKEPFSAGSKITSDFCPGKPGPNTEVIFERFLSVARICGRVRIGIKAAPLGVRTKTRDGRPRFNAVLPSGFSADFEHSA